jgi:methylmalonyl-CoA mutase C-terminal domain/subunit
MTLAPLVVKALRGRGSEIPVVVGGIIPDQDVDELKAAGVAAVLGPGATADAVVSTVASVVS